VPLDGIPFGQGPRRCPGVAHARALAEGVIEALRPTAPV
jgi:cytochrome P450